MKSLNKIQLIGYVGKDPELRHTSGGKAVATFSLATSEKYKDNEQTTWHNLVVWEKLAEVVSQYVKKGTPLYVEGKLTNRSYDDKDGNKRYITEVVVSNMIMLGSKESGGGAVPKNQINVAEFEQLPDSDLPF